MDTPAEAAAWLIEALDALGVAPAVLVGHSLGGAVSLEAILAAGRESTRFVGLAMVASGSKLKVASEFLARAEHAKAPFRVDEAFGPGTPKETMDTYHQRAPVSPRTCLADWRACNRFDRRNDLAAVRVPTLILYGNEDLTTPPKFQTFLAENIAGATARGLSGIGHMLPWEAPDLFASAVFEWCASTGI